MDPQAPEPRSLPASDRNGGGVDAAASNNRGSAIRHLAILGSILVPIACLPYLMTRRQFTTLRRMVDDMGVTTALLKQRHLDGDVRGGDAGASALLAQIRMELQALRAQVQHNESQHADITLDVINLNEEVEQARRDVLSLQDGKSALPDDHVSREELTKTLHEGLHNIRQEMEASKAEVQEQLRLLSGGQDALRSELFKFSDQMQSIATGPHAMDGSELHRLLQEARQTRAIFGAIGSSLGDVATVIQRVEIEMGHEHPGGYDPVERLRVLALRMQDGTFREKQEGR
ncbi:hypothetical protein B0H15DRAFT_1020040 [Mycena belliarum]|uniref:Uncharacterized protein n=1 Tax=Mycena belliarum TaxID=1033014 RepID=A0AAD6UAC1_9AGAR|nr:hypothetical protein B0H15DRAFT_1020040 [Mycena belliae]